MPRTVVVERVGDVDPRTVSAERDRIDRLIDSGVADPLCLDLGQVEFIDSGALGLLVHVREACENAEVERRLLNVSARTRQLFSVTGPRGLVTARLRDVPVATVTLVGADGSVADLVTS